MSEKLDPSLQALRAIDQRAEAIRAYAGTDCHTHLVGLLEALSKSYMLELVEITSDELQLKQGATRQVLALLGAITRPNACARL